MSSQISFLIFLKARFWKSTSKIHNQNKLLKKN